MTLRRLRLHTCIGCRTPNTITASLWRYGQRDCNLHKVSVAANLYEYAELNAYTTHSATHAVLHKARQHYTLKRVRKRAGSSAQKPVR
jgi:hypothetical protein